jgi:hypothetical protein
LTCVLHILTRGSLSSSFRWQVWHHLATKCWLLGWRFNRLYDLSIPRQHVWSMNLLFGTDNLFLFFFFSPPWFPCLALQSSLSICFFFEFGFYSFNYYLFYMKNIYKIGFFFKFHPFLIFFYVKFGPHSFNCSMFHLR